MSTSQFSRQGEYCECPPHARDLFVDVDENKRAVTISCRTCGGSGDRKGTQPEVIEVRIYQGFPHIVEAVHDDGNVFTTNSLQMFNYRAWKYYRQWYWEQYKDVYDVKGQKGWDDMMRAWGAMSHTVAIEDEDPEIVAAEAIITKIQSRKPRDVLDHLLSFPEFYIPTVSTTWDLDGEKKKVVMVMSDNIATACAERLSLHKFAHICRMNKWTLHPSQQIRLKGRRFRVWFFDPEVLFPTDHNSLEHESTFLRDQAVKMAEDYNNKNRVAREKELAAKSGNTDGTSKDDVPSETSAPHNGKAHVTAPKNGRSTAPLMTNTLEGVRAQLREHLDQLENSPPLPQRTITAEDICDILSFTKQIQDDHMPDGPTCSTIAEGGGFIPRIVEKVMNHLYEEGEAYQRRIGHWLLI